MTRPRKPKGPTVAALARELHAEDPTLTSTAIARLLSQRLRRVVAHQQVQAALRASGGKPGRRVDWAARVERLRAQLAEAERELAAQQGTVLRAAGQ